MRTIDEIRGEVPDTYTCALHGDYRTKVDTYRIRWACVACEDETRKAQSKLDALWRRRHAWENCGLPYRYRNRTFANWIPQTKPQEKVLTAVKAFAANLQLTFDEGRGLILTGDVGTGKTHLLAALTHEIVRLGASCRFVSVGDLFADIKRSFGTKEEFDVSDLQNVNFLLLDDIGASRGTEWEVSVLHELLRYRYDATLPTILTTNVSDLERAVGSRIADRFAENMLRLTIAGPSQRGAALKVIGPEGLAEPPREITVKVCESGQMRDRTLHANGLEPPSSRNR